MAGLMKALSNMYEKPIVSNKVHLMRKLFNLKMSKGAIVTNHLNELNSTLTQLSSVDINFIDEIQVLILLSFLPEKWNDTVTVINNSFGSMQMKQDIARDLNLSDEIRQK